MQDNQNNLVKPTEENKVHMTKPKITSAAGSFNQKEMSISDIIAPETLDVDFDFMKVNDVYVRSLYISGYPRFVSPGWLEPIINFDHSLDISFYIYPVEGKSVLDDLRRKIAEMEAEISTDIQRGKVVDPSTTAKLEDARSLQETLVKGSERFYQFSFYVTIPAATLEELNDVTKQVKSTLGSLLVIAENATLDMENGFLSTAPLGADKLVITRNMDTTSLATTFPFTSAELSSDTGILYGINSQNESFIIFDRFSLENANCTIFAVSGGGKSLDYDDNILYQGPNGEIKRDKIGNVVEGLIKKDGLIKIGKEIEGVVEPKIKVYAFNESLKSSWSNVEVAARKISPRILYNITTASGRQVKITKDHCLVALKRGSVIATKGSDIRVGDYLPIPRKIDSKKVSVNSHLGYPLNKEMLTLLGFITSEGNIRKSFVSISNIDETVLELIRSSAKSLDLKIVPIYNYPQKSTIRGYHIRSRSFADFVRNIDGDGKSGEKSAPNILFSLSDEQVSVFLRAYFEGDGGVEEHGISATTKSEQLASDLCYLLLRFGVIARLQTVSKAATNTKAKKLEKYYKVNISGQSNISNFIKNVGFITKRKNSKANALLKPENTNVDIVPEIKNIFKEIYYELYFSSEIPSPEQFAEIKLGIYNPSRENLLSLIYKIEKRVREIENLETDSLSTLKSLPALGEIIKTGNQKELNRELWKKIGHSWQTMRSGTSPFLKNTLAAVSITHGHDYSTQNIGGALYRSFKETGESLRFFDKSLWESIVIRKTGNTLYQRVEEARDYIVEKYYQKKKRLATVREKIETLKTLATSDLFWDPIVKIERQKSKHKYVYDLQVANKVFLAGRAGVFVHNSFTVKLEALRSLMLGTEVIIIDPEAEYKALAEATGGEYISFAFGSPAKINPFDLSQIVEPGENQLGLKILSLHSLFKVIMGQLSPTQEALLDRSLIMTYRAKGITQDPETQTKEPPLMEDLYKTLIGMEVPEALDLAARIEKFVKGSFVGIFDKQTNINLQNPMTVFSVRDMQDVLRPIAMFIILDYIWTRVKKDLKRRLLIVDEAWHMMKYPDSAQFLWSVVKRARKYYLGLTTITQDVEDFLGQDIGKAIVTNSAMRILLKQSPAAIDKIGETFYLSQGEKQLLLAANVGEGIFFAGPHHAPIRVTASPEEYKLLSTKPQEQAAAEGRVPSPNETVAPAEAAAMAQGLMK